MARYLRFAALTFCVGGLIVVAAIVSRQVYLRSAAAAGVSNADEEAARLMLIRCESMHGRLQNRHGKATDGDKWPRTRCRDL